MNRRFTALALGIVLHPLASAAEISCPDLGKAVQVAPCPSEEELRYTFNGFCSDNSRLYAKDMDTCVSYQNYRQVKNIALWEAAGGEFQAYLSCDLAPAAIQAAKRTGELIPLCHPLGLENCQVEISVNEAREVVIECTASVTGKTGIEMEALTGASVAALTIYDMCKAMSQHIVIKETRLIAKTGGKRDFIL